MTRSTWRIALRYSLALTAVVFLLLAFWQAWNATSGRVLPSPASLAMAGATLALSLGCATAGWVTLLEGAASRSTLAFSFLLSQLGKYLPGGFWQPFGQVGFATEAGASLARAGAALPVHLATQAAAGGTIGALTCVLLPTAPTSWRLAALGAASLVVILSRRLFVILAHSVHWAGLKAVRGEAMPSQQAIYRSFVWAAATLLCSGTAFAVLLSSVEPRHELPGSISVFALAWLIGFIAVPVPAGLGVRELVIVAFLPGNPGAIVAASLCHRLLAMAAEVAGILVVRTWRE